MLPADVFPLSADIYCCKLKNHPIFATDLFVVLLTHQTMETSVEKPIRQKDQKKLIFGFIVIFAGLALLAINFDILPYSLRHIIFSWQMLLIAIGVISMSGGERSTPGIILIMIGSFFIIPEIFNLHISFARIFWPVLLIAIGIFILVKRGGIHDERWHKHHFNRERRSHGIYESTSPLDDGFINETNIFSGSKHRISQQVFRGGKISTLFGGSEIDLSQAKLGEGRNELIVECMFGGITLIVPGEWRVVMNVSSIMGGFSDKRLVFRQDPNSPDFLVVKGTAIFGGGEIKSI